MKKIFLFALIACMMLGVLAGCSEQAETSDTSSLAVSSSEAVSDAESAASEAESTAQEKTTVNILTISGPTGIGMAYLMQENDNNNTQNDYQFTVTTSPSDVMTAIVSESVDIAACPINLASKINAKTENGIQLLAINTLGVLSIVTNGKEINSFADLNGLEVVASGEGATPEFAMKYLCEAYGISVNLQFVDEFSTAATMVASGECQVALLAEPSVSSARIANKDLTVALSLTRVWEEAGQAGLIDNVELAQGCVIVRAAFAKEHPEAVEKFLQEYAASVAYASAEENLESAASLCETYKIVPKAAVAKMALPNCNLVCITGADMKEMAEKNLKVLFDYDAKSIGGKMPEDGFYYAKD